MRGELASSNAPATTGWRGYLSWLALAALALIAPHFLPGGTLGALDLVSNPQSATALHQTAGDDFPGSAFFYAEGAFDPAPGAAQKSSIHVFALSDGPAATAVPFRAYSALDQYRATNCLTSAIYYEAGNEPDDGQRAVAQVVLNRVRHPAWPNSVCAVVYEGSERTDTRCQFTFSCDGAMARIPSSASWARARRVADAALAGSVYAPVGLATHYHTLAVHPGWAGRLTPVAVVGAHIFYRLPGVNGSVRAFTSVYSGHENQSGPAPRATPRNPLLLPPIAPIIALANDKAAPEPLALPAQLDSLPQSTIRPEFRNSGQPLS